MTDCCHRSVNSLFGVCSADYLVEEGELWFLKRDLKERSLQSGVFIKKARHREDAGLSKSPRTSW